MFKSLRCTGIDTAVTPTVTRNHHLPDVISKVGISSQGEKFTNYSPNFNTASKNLMSTFRAE